MSDGIGARETTDDERDAEDGDVFVPANAAVAANVLAGTRRRAGRHPDQDN